MPVKWARGQWARAAKLLLGLLMGLLATLAIARVIDPSAVAFPRPSAELSHSPSEGCCLFADAAGAETDDGADYFDAISPGPQGHLIWPERPVWVYVQPPDPGQASLGQQQWTAAVEGAIADWSPHIELASTDQPEQANIRIFRAAPPLKWSPDGPRARNAETQFRLFWRADDSGNRCFRQQQTIFLSDRQGADLLRGTARHELGHALGLWGHSPDPDDALYATQVGHPPQISARDINTLRRVYQQPLGRRCSDSTSGASYGTRENAVF